MVTVSLAVGNLKFGLLLSSKQAMELEPEIQALAKKMEIVDRMSMDDKSVGEKIRDICLADYAAIRGPYGV